MSNDWANLDEPFSATLKRNLTIAVIAACVVAAIVWWFLGGTVLFAGMFVTAQALGFALPVWRWWSGAGFIAIELVVHAGLVLRGVPNFYRGDA
ncbi:MAG: hypothetical protein JST92_24975 [Deltaproteobacteria bacterium]|nr:hypothetical protein [Deltaproteobacteria bacterium]